MSAIPNHGLTERVLAEVREPRALQVYERTEHSSAKFGISFVNAASGRRAHGS